MSFLTFRKDLSIPGLLRTARQVFEKLPDDGHRDIPLADYLMSGLALFGLKYPSLLQFDRAARDCEVQKANLRTLYGIERAPCDTAFRERLDTLDPSALRPLYKKLFSLAQRGKVFEDYTFLEDHYLLSIDGTGFFSSKSVHCEHCCEKHHRDGTVTYYHQALGAALVHPDHKEVFPLCPEPILKQDGAKKNDCERNAAKRLLKHLRREHPHLKMAVIEDGLASNGPHIRLLKELDLRFILTAKPSDHPFLFDWVANTEGVVEKEIIDEDGWQHHFRYLNDVPLNDAHFDLSVNFLEYQEISPKGKVKRFSWVTDFFIEEENLIPLMRGARARWKIENETFNTLKNQGYHFEHNFGHGNRHLSTVMMQLMMLAFLIDQLQQRSCRLFQAAQQACYCKRVFWEAMRSRFNVSLVPDWEAMYRSIIRPAAQVLAYDTS